jgi:hypothetical protein
MRKCKLCGGKAELIASKDMIIHDYALGYKVICSRIGCKNSTQWYPTEAQAISSWQDSNKS